VTITIIDTSFGTWNLGDEIIMEAVNETLYEMFPNARVFRIPCHEALSRRSYYFLRKSELCFIGGTNILASKGWRLRWYDPMFLKNALCMGVTWGGAKTSPVVKDRLLLRRVLSAGKLHSVRDRYTKGLLDQMGIQSVFTCCPTMWKLSSTHCEAIPKEQAPDVAFALTAYRQDPVADRRMIDILRKHYRTLHFFPQGHGDSEYLGQLGTADVRMIAPNLRSFDHFLANEHVDYVGNRLHGGIRAMQFKKRSLVIGIDHRSVEIGKDTGLSVLRRGEIHNLDEWIKKPVATQINLPGAEIENWKAQFSA